MDEIAVMRQEKLQNQNKIRNLLDRQDYAVCAGFYCSILTERIKEAINF